MIHSASLTPSWGGHGADPEEKRELRDNPRRGLPAPWVSDWWKDDGWAVAQIRGRDGRLSVEQVRAITSLAGAHPAVLIAQRIGALNESQVQRVLDGQTYTGVS